MSVSLRGNGRLPYMVNSFEIRWLAGIMEGEGSFHDGCNNIHVTIDMTDQDVMEHVARIMNAKLYGPYDNGPLGRKPKWRVRVTGPVAAGWMMTLYPLLGIRRRSRIQELLSVWKSKVSNARGKLYCVSGHRLSGTNLMDSADGKRRCLTCARMYTQNYRERQAEAAVN